MSFAFVIMFPDHIKENLELHWWRASEQLLDLQDYLEANISKYPHVKISKKRSLINDVINTFSFIKKINYNEK